LKWAETEFLLALRFVVRFWCGGDE